MAVKTCSICGNEFSGATGANVCGDCKTQKCPVCGKDVKLTYHARGQLKKNGYVCCCRSHSLIMSHRSGAFSSDEPVLRKCKLCGRDFHSNSINSWYCDDCKVKPCIVCGKPVELDSWRMSKYQNDGFITCGDVDCANEVRRRTCQEKEGVDNPAQFAESRRKMKEYVDGLSEDELRESVDRMVSKSRSPEANAKRIDTMIERYGVEYGVQTENCKERSHSPEARAKARETMFDRTGYGSNLERPDISERAHSPESIEKAKAKVREREGVDYMVQLDWVREKANGPEASAKRLSTNMARYGKPYHLCNDTERLIREYHSEHPKATLSEIAYALGVSYSAVQLQNSVKRIGVPVKRSYFEDVIADFLDSIGVAYERHCRDILLDKEVDFYVKDKGVAIEVNDFLTHSVNYNPFGKELVKPRQYHWDKTRECADKGVRLIHAWEHCLPAWNAKSSRLGSWDVLKDVIEHALGISHEKVYARNTKVVEFPSIQLKKFFDENNINGYRNAKTAYCLVPKGIENPTPDDVLMAYAVGRAHFGKGKYDAEIARGACKLGLTVVGGASKLWSYIIENTDYESIVYYVDANYFSASSISYLENVEYVGHVDSFWNYFLETDELRNREPGRNAEIKAGYEDGSIWQIYNAGTYVYVWHRNPK